MTDPATPSPLEVMRAAAMRFRQYERSHLERATALLGVDCVQRAARLEKSQANREMAELCESAIPQMEEDAARIGDLYGLGLLVEEMAEVGKLIGKGLRFGMDAPGPEGVEYQGKSARQLLPAELGDASAAIDWACLDGLAAFGEVIGAREAKKAKLLSPNSLDSNGRRLAPKPRGQR